MARAGMTIRSFPVAIWVGLALIVAASLGHLWLEYDRGTRVAPQLKQGPELVAHTLEVIATAQSLQRAVHDAERGQRGYLLTGDPAYLEPYRRSEQEFQPILAKLKEMTADNPEQQRRWPILEQQLDIKLAELKQTLDVHDRRGVDAARQTVRTNIGLDAMQGVNGIIDAAIATERGLLSERLARAAEYERAGRRAALIGAGLEFAALILGTVLVLLALRSIHKANVARQEAERRFHFFTDAVTDYAIYMLDPQGRVVDWNAGAQRIKGYAASEIVGEHFSRFYTEDERNAGVPQRALELAAKDGRYEAEGWRLRKDGTRFVANVLINPLRDTSGQLVGFAKITRDITERVQQQRALAQFQKMDAIGQLTGGIAHDFNNLLHVMRNAIDIVERQLRDIAPEVRKYLDMLKRNVERATSLTRRLLAFSRRQVLDPKPLDPNALLIDVTTLLKPVLGEGIAFETVIGAGVWPIVVDANQLETAILNVTLNARDAMSGVGKLTIEISNAFLDANYAAAHAEVRPGQYVMIAISDTGAGMTPDIVARAFEPFFTTKEVGQGTGLGLSQVYGFIKQSGGHAKIYSEPGQGTTVKLYLPRLPAPDPVQQEQDTHRAPPARTEGHRTILVTEDDEDVSRFTVHVLEELGYRVFTARDAASALRVLEAQPGVDLLFTDIGLPGGINGRQLADEAVRRFPQIKVLFTTGYTVNAVIHQGRLDPGVELLIKPFTQNALAEKVMLLLPGCYDGS
jgi:PAS domain S-box-containing protein